MMNLIRNPLGALFLISQLIACAPQRISSNPYQKATEECVADVAQGRFVVQLKDGRILTVEAESESEFLDGFFAQHENEIELAEPDYKVQLHEHVIATPNDFGSWGVDRIGAQEIWKENVRGKGVTVAVIDTGMDINHPQLRSRILVNTGETGLDSKGRDRATNGVDDDGNGYVDDAYGYDFVKNRGLQGDYAAHGTHVAGIVVAEHQSWGGSSVQGVAPEASILPLAFLDDTGSGYMSDAVRAMKYAIRRGARVINASWGGRICSASLRKAIADLTNTNVIFVAAAGNEARNIDRTGQYPASFNFPAQITVGATGYYDYMAEYSNYGSKNVHIFAPGSEILSTVPGGLAVSSGTSMAAPFVSGTVALLMSAFPQATTKQIRAALYATAYKQSHYLNASQGRLDIRRGLQELQQILSADASH